MTEYLVICRDLNRARILSKSLRVWLTEKQIFNGSFRKFSHGYLFKFRDTGTSVLFISEAYAHIALRGFRGTYVNEHDVERFLDEHKEDQRWSATHS